MKKVAQGSRRLDNWLPEVADKYLLKFFLFFLFISPPFTGSANAQSAPGDDLKLLPPEIATRVAQISPEKAVSGKAPPIQILPSSVEKDADWVNPLPITLHLRGTSGTALKDAKKLQEERKRVRPLDYERMRGKVATDYELMMKRYKAQRKMHPLPNCHRDSQKFTPFAEASSAGTVQDILFLKPGETQFDRDESFGEKTIIVIYDPEKPSNWAMYGKVNGIKCLPSRIRILGRGFSIEEGLPALKNYESDPYGSGVLSETVKSRLNRLFDEQGSAL